MAHTVVVSVDHPHKAKKSSSSAPHATSKMSKIPSSPRAKSKIEKTLHEYKEGDLHSRSKTGPRVTSRRQAVAIALNQARKAK